MTVLSLSIFITVGSYCIIQILILLFDEVYLYIWRIFFRDKEREINNVTFILYAELFML